MSTCKERRCYEIKELRTDVTGNVRKVGGYAAVFEKLSEDLGAFRSLREKIQKGAFSDSIKNGDVRAFWNHNPDIVLGRNKNGTLRLWEDTEGLAFDLDLPDTQAGRDAFTSIERGDVSAMSFGFMVRNDQIERPKNENEPIIRTLLDVELFEVSPVAFPAYPQTEVQSRSIDDRIKAACAEWEAEDKAQNKDLRGRQKIVELSGRFQKSIFGSCKTQKKSA